eukprot:CAMPEP_0202967732 /NCGR_PEP_ID=MMETSP1396-20130829/12729_1 /ASSEMBLY_ACC=CAM_ASM_000872 /TAXON_ID= /ORGANISM="Pseudokeronopsis sp., Strain Brazil" /LENGTH=193 /DNA_ID=CAMNT_0049693149 /DNA_START=678 /DNA_END=1256 /DNA_ORIENTATION=+
MWAHSFLALMLLYYYAYAVFLYGLASQLSFSQSDVDYLYLEYGFSLVVMGVAIKQSFNFRSNPGLTALGYYCVLWFHIFHLYSLVPTDHYLSLLPTLSMLVQVYFTWMGVFTSRNYYTLVYYNQTYKERRSLGVFSSGEYFVPKPTTEQEKNAFLRNFYLGYSPPQSNLRRLVPKPPSLQSQGANYQQVDQHN